MSKTRRIGGSRRKIGGSRRKIGGSRRKVAGTKKGQKRKTARRAYKKSHKARCSHRRRRHH